MASPDSGGQNERKSFDDLSIVSPSALERPCEALTMLSTPTAESSSARNCQPSAEFVSPSTMLSTPAESSSAPIYQPYDVFINHCGRDTKHTLANNIYKKLDVTGLKVFLDKDELRYGDVFPEAIQNAIATASVHIAIFSKHYAESPWCLAELVYMLSFRHKAKCIPIFYHVEPSTVRWAGIYEDAFTKYETKNRYTSELQSWKTALYDASHYTGPVINDACDEEKIIMDVVTSVLKELKEVRLDVTKYQVALDEIEQDFNTITALPSTPGRIQIVGIWGMGGVGKTTLAKHIYNKYCSTINISSFLFDIRSYELYKKQKKLLDDLQFKYKDFDNVEDGKSILKHRLKSVPVLIVLDDVDHTNQLDALLPAKNELGCGSLIIVTTRDLEVLDAWDISTVYKINPLDFSYAKKLFCWHAFGQPSPLRDFEELAKKFIDACCGLPLSLKVLGVLLHGKKTQEYWKCQYDKVSKSVPGDIESNLRISYDALDSEEKEMFLDLACFFIGWTSSNAIATWNGSKWNGLCGWETLLNKCLVEIEENNEIRMHDHLRDLGRKIANQQSPYRLWFKEQIIQIHSQQDPIQIRGIANAVGENCIVRDGEIRLKTTQGQRTFKPGSLGLKIFIATGQYDLREYVELLTGRFLLAEEILCLCWDCICVSIRWLPMKELRILRFHGEDIKALWDCDEDLPLQLRELRIGRGYCLETINGLQKLTSLETLRLEGCELKTLPSLAGLASLKVIDLCNCRQLEKIENSEGLISLQTLTLHACYKLKALPRLAEEIELVRCDKLEKMESLEGLISLQTLRLHECYKLKTLPSLAGATSLKVIDLLACHELEKIEGLEGLR